MFVAVLAIETSFAKHQLRGTMMPMTSETAFWHVQHVRFKLHVHHTKCTSIDRSIYLYCQAKQAGRQARPGRQRQCVHAHIHAQMLTCIRTYIHTCIQVSTHVKFYKPIPTPMSVSISIFVSRPVSHIHIIFIYIYIYI